MLEVQKRASYGFKIRFCLYCMPERNVHTEESRCFHVIPRSQTRLSHSHWLCMCIHISGSMSVQNSRVGMSHDLRELEIQHKYATK